MDTPIEINIHSGKSNVSLLLVESIEKAEIGLVDNKDSSLSLKFNLVYNRGYQVDLAFDSDEYWQSSDIYNLIEIITFFRELRGRLYLKWPAYCMTINALDKFLEKCEKSDIKPYSDLADDNKLIYDNSLKSLNKCYSNFRQRYEEVKNNQ